LREAGAARDAKLKKDLTRIERQANKSLWQLHEREAEEMSEVRNTVGRLEVHLPMVLKDNSLHASAGVEVGHASDEF
jgi:hypothetical protein